MGNRSRLVMRFNQSNAIDVLCVVVLVAYFLHFSLPAVGGGFPGHDMMNMYSYWLPGMLKSLRANICFWTSSYRPGGALYYLPLYHFFGLNPQPYRIAQISILAAPIPVVNRCGKSPPSRFQSFHSFLCNLRIDHYRRSLMN